MLREQRSREKLEAYYRQFRQNGVIDQNVHPWVADSWLKSRDLNIPSDRIDTIRMADKGDFAELQKKHSSAIEFLGNISDNIREFLQH